MSLPFSLFLGWWTRFWTREKKLPTSRQWAIGRFPQVRGSEGPHHHHHWVVRHPKCWKGLTNRRHMKVSANGEIHKERQCISGSGPERFVRRWGLTLSGYRLSLGCDESVLRLWWHICPSVNTLRSTELCAWIGWIARYVKFIPIKLFYFFNCDPSRYGFFF